MSLLVVGSVAFDAVETPFGKCEKMLGGSASHFSISASYFTDVSVVGVVGGDFGDDDAIVFADFGHGTLLVRGCLSSMIPKSGHRFSEKIMLQQ